jgi:uncharacterized protein YceK
MACTLGGCATAHNLKHERQIYGGVRLDAPAVPCILSGFSPTHPPQDGFSVVLGTWALTDLPFSAVADTLTLPVTVPAALARQLGKQESAQESVDQPAKPVSPP